MQVVTVAITGVIHVANILSLADWRALVPDGSRDAVFCQVEVQLVGCGVGGGILDDQVIGTVWIVIVAAVVEYPSHSAARSQQGEHGAIGKIKSIPAILIYAGKINQFMPNAAFQHLGSPRSPGKLVTANCQRLCRCHRICFQQEGCFQVG